jgi:hypothetical protein
MKSAIFPTAYILADAIGSPVPAPSAHLSPLGASAVSVIFFLGYIRGTLTNPRAHVPPGLRALAEKLTSLPEGGVVCLPGGYSDYVTYRTGRSVLWGSHSGSLDKFELVSPVWRERVEDAARRHGVRYLIVERSWVDPAVLKLDARCALVAQEALSSCSISRRPQELTRPVARDRAFHHVAVREGNAASSRRARTWRLVGVPRRLAPWP